MTSVVDWSQLVVAQRPGQRQEPHDAAERVEDRDEHDARDHGREHDRIEEDRPQVGRERPDLLQHEGDEEGERDRHQPAAGRVDERDPQGVVEVRIGEQVREVVEADVLELADQAPLGHAELERLEDRVDEERPEQEERGSHEQPASLVASRDQAVPLPEGPLKARRPQRRFTRDPSGP